MAEHKKIIIGESKLRHGFVSSYLEFIIAYIVRRIILIVYVFVLFFPVLIGLLWMQDLGYIELSGFITDFVLFPVFIYGEPTIHISNLMFAFFVWSLVFSLVGEALKRATKGRMTFANRDKLMHRLYLAVYLVSFLVIPFIPLGEDDSLQTVYIFLLAFFIVGYGSFWLYVLMGKVLQRTKS